MRTRITQVCQEGRAIGARTDQRSVIGNCNGVHGPGTLGIVVNTIDRRASGLLMRNRYVRTAKSKSSQTLQGSP